MIMKGKDLIFLIELLRRREFEVRTFRISDVWPEVRPRFSTLVSVRGTSNLVEEIDLRSLELQIVIPMP